MVKSSATSFISIALVLVCLCVSTANANFYGSNSNVINLTRKNFAQIFHSPHVWMVEFYAPWCGHCKNLAPAWEAAATNLKGIVKVAAINCDEEKELAGMFQIQGFPTIKLFPSETSENPYQKGAPWKQPIDYQGARSAAAIANFATQHLPNRVRQVTPLSHEKFLATEPSIPKALLFTDKAKTTSLYKALALEFTDRMILGEVQSKNTNGELEQKYSVTKFPSLFIISPDGQLLTHEGSINRDSLLSFLEQHALSRATGKNGENSRPPPSSPPDPEVIEAPELTTQDVFDQKCKSVGLCGIAVFNTEEGATEKYKDTLLAIAEKHSKQFKFSWVDGPKHPQFVSDLNIAMDMYPQFIVYSPKKKAVAHYVGAFELEKVSGWLSQVLRGSKRIYPVDKEPKFPSRENNEQQSEKDSEGERDSRSQKDEL